MDLTALLAGSSLADEIDFLAVRLFASGTRRVNARLADLGLRARSYAVLALACGSLPLRQRDLVSVLELDPSQVVALVGELEGAGLIRREAHPDDRRVNVIHATAAGRDLMVRARAITAEVEGEALAMLDEEERAQLRSLLRRVVLTHAGQRSVKPADP